ncbi:hypothetical protein K440DRAFT_284627 [Wilcoxina mikolae CBS 423.85]|nr:hypothetical protein K440DRAFT_284627 [Wilcoxina mikolae CBS 423.85]
MKGTSLYYLQQSGLLYRFAAGLFLYLPTFCVRALKTHHAQLKRVHRPEYQPQTISTNHSNILLAKVITVTTTNANRQGIRVWQCKQLAVKKSVLVQFSIRRGFVDRPKWDG